MVMFGNERHRSTEDGLVRAANSLNLGRAGHLPVFGEILLLSNVQECLLSVALDPAWLTFHRIEKSALFCEPKFLDEVNPAWASPEFIQFGSSLLTSSV